MLLFSPLLHCIRITPILIIVIINITSTRERFRTIEIEMEREGGTCDYKGPK